MGPPFLQSTHTDQQSGSKHRNGTTLFTVHSYRPTVGLQAQKWYHPFYSPLIQTKSRAPSTEMGPPYLQSTHTDQQSGSKKRDGTTLLTVNSYRPAPSTQMGPPFLQSTHRDQQSGSKHRKGTSLFTATHRDQQSGSKHRNWTTLFTVHSYRPTVGLQAQKWDHPFYSPLIQSNSRAPSTEMGPPFLQSTHTDQQSGSKHRTGTTLSTVHS